MKHQSFSCDDERGDGFIRAWRSGEVPDLCESSAESKVECFDSMEGSRYCKFENAMVCWDGQLQRVEGILIRSASLFFIAESNVCMTTIHLCA